MDSIAKSYKSPAKINLFLHVLNKRADGYHNLQTWFQFVGLADELEFRQNNYGVVNISSDIEIGSLEDNLIYKAIRAFEKQYQLTNVGIDVTIRKNIPMGAGLGGGSSNAAVALMAMRDFYKPELKNEDMLELGKSLGADVPIFLYGKSAWAEGIGEKLTTKLYKEQYALLVKPNIHISTAEFFTSPVLEKHTTLISKDSSLNMATMINDFEAVFFARYPEFSEELSQIGLDFRMTGTGSCFFALSEDRALLEKVARKMDNSLDKWVVKTLNYAC